MGSIESVDLGHADPECVTDKAEKSLELTNYFTVY